MSRVRIAALGLLAVLAVAGCTRRTAVPAAPRYVVGAGYQAGGTWYYPHEAFQYDATGIAAIRASGGGLTANGELPDAGALEASHQTLQLPAIALVTNLGTGLQIRVRINDRGPAQPSRILAVSRRAAELLGFDGPDARVRIQVEEGPSLALREQLRGGPVLALAAAPRGAVTAEALAPPPGVGQSGRVRSAGAAVAPPPGQEVAAARVPDRLPETVQRVLVQPGQLMIAAGSFGEASYARQVGARLAGLGARVDRRGEGRSDRFVVSAGPFASVPAADAALDQALRAGVTDARIVVE